MIKIASQNREPAVIGSGPISHHAGLIDRVAKTQREYRRFLRIQWGVWTILVLLAAGGLLALADYHWVLSSTARLTNWALAGTLAIIFAAKTYVRQRQESLNRQATALEIETAFPDLGQRVCTTLEYAEPTPSTMPALPSLVRALTTETEERTYRLDFKHVVPWHRLRWPSISTAGLIVLFIAALCIWPEARIAAMRLFFLPVHYTQLKIEPGNQSVKFEGDVKIRAILTGRPVKKVELLSRKAGSGDSWASVSLGPDDSENSLLLGTLETTLKKCREEIDYRVTAGEVESETYRLTILHPLLLKKTEATIEPPAYTRKKPEKQSEGNVSVIEGSNVGFRFELDRPAQTAWLKASPRGKAAATAKTIPPIPLKTNGKSLEGALANITQDLDYEITAEAADGMKLEPQKFRIAVQPDRKPTLRFVKPDAVIEALPTTEVTMQVAAKDDFGVAKVSIVYRIGDGPWERLLLDEKSDQPVSLTSLAILYLEEHKLNFQDGIVYYAVAEDNYPTGPHVVASEMQFIDIRAFKREFQAGRPGKSGKCVSLELLISRQRTNLQHTFGQCGEGKADARVAKRLAKSERSLQKLTEEFAEMIAQRFGPVPCLYEAIDAMKAASTELDGKKMEQACRQEEIALAKLIEARQNLRNLLTNPKTGSEAEQLDYEAQKNQPEIPKDEDENEEEEKPDDNLQNQIAELAKTERETVEELDGKSGGNAQSAPSPQDSQNKSSSESKSQGNSPSQSNSQSQSNSPSQGNSPSQSNTPSKGNGQSPGEASDLAERQQQAAEKAAEIAKKMEEDEAITDLAQERIANAEKAIRRSAQSLKQGDQADARREAKEAAEQLERLARQVAGLKAADLAAKLQASESLARQLAKQQREAEQNAEKNNSESKSKSEGKGQGKGEGQGRGEGQGGEEGNPSDSQSSAERQRAVADEVRSVEDILEESRRDAGTADADLVRALEEAAAANPPKEIAEQMEKAARELTSGEPVQAVDAIRMSAQRLEALADQLEAARRGFEQPKLEALMAAEKQAAELQKQLSSDVPSRQRGDVDKKLLDLRGAMALLSAADVSLRDDANQLVAALEGNDSNATAWRQVRQGYYALPKRYPAAVERVAQALQVRIQELILKDAILDRDQPVPEQYRKQVEEYYKTLSEDLR